MATSNGGHSWHPIRVPCPRFAPDVGGVANSSGGAWVVCIGGPGAGNQAKAIYSTADNGQNWRRLIAVALPGIGKTSSGGIASYGYPSGLSFSSDGTGLLWEGRGTTYLTHDGGYRWRPLTSLTKPEANFGSSAAVISSEEAFLLQTGGSASDAMVLYATTDAGSSWVLVHGWKSRPGY
jgi:photosystem II stability/assembly factor-like uncharacterized protein